MQNELDQTSLRSSASKLLTVKNIWKSTVHTKISKS